MREAGWYRVKLNGKWICLEWTMPEGYWSEETGHWNPISDKDLDEIDERIIEMPQ